MKKFIVLLIFILPLCSYFKGSLTGSYRYNSAIYKTYTYTISSGILIISKKNYLTIDASGNYGNEIISNQSDTSMDLSLLLGLMVYKKLKLYTLTEYSLNESIDLIYRQNYGLGLEYVIYRSDRVREISARVIPSIMIQNLENEHSIMPKLITQFKIWVLLGSHIELESISIYSPSYNNNELYNSITSDTILKLKYIDNVNFIIKNILNYNTLSDPYYLDNIVSLGLEIELPDNKIKIKEK